jgi:hypothetical protein
LRSLTPAPPELRLCALPEQDGVFEAYFCHQRFMRIDLRDPLEET